MCVLPTWELQALPATADLVWGGLGNYYTLKVELGPETMESNSNRGPSLGLGYAAVVLA